MSSSLKVILFKGKILNNGEHPILIRVIKDRKSSYLSIGASSSLKNWDVRAGLPKKSHPDFKELLLLIDIKRAEASSLIFGIKTASTEVSVEKTLKLSPVRRSKLTPLRRGNLTPSKQSIWSMFNSEVYIFNCRISRGSILVRRRRDDLADYSNVIIFDWLVEIIGCETKISMTKAVQLQRFF